MRSPFGARANPVTAQSHRPGPSGCFECWLNKKIKHSVAHVARICGPDWAAGCQRMALLQRSINMTRCYWMLWNLSEPSRSLCIRVLPGMFSGALWAVLATSPQYTPGPFCYRFQGFSVCVSIGRRPESRRAGRLGKWLSLRERESLWVWTVSTPPFWRSGHRLSAA